CNCVALYIGPRIWADCFFNDKSVTYNWGGNRTGSNEEGRKPNGLHIFAYPPNFEREGLKVVKNFSRKNPWVSPTLWYHVGDCILVGIHRCAGWGFDGGRQWFRGLRSINTNEAEAQLVNQTKISSFSRRFLGAAAATLLLLSTAWATPLGL